ncbi:hypothetical protein E8E13_008164 [Curvularia kusanoi]|uniref:F-box domain-containing protein n=1 Tax=Curvularia kusanoi TaxID=90978 RepID=A0A9P4TC12_CURKU|nr:hypothetical protein E8E13_008164 [Curvularia kusanoi]
MEAYFRFDDLPAEIKFDVFCHLPIPSLKMARLVSQVWSEMVAHVLFSTYEIDVFETQNYSLDSIIEGPRKGFLHSVRHLTICKPRQDTNRMIRIGFLRLIGALPRDTLISFISHVQLYHYEIGLLLKTQSKIQTLDITSDDLPGSNAVQGNLSELTDLTLKAARISFRAYPLFGKWVAHMPLLRDLNIHGLGVWHPTPFPTWTVPSGTPLRKLSRLHLHSVSFTASAANLPSQFDLPSLENLCLRDCVSASILLDAFAAAYKSGEGNVLEEFEFQTDQEWGHNNPAIRFLSSLRKIKVVKLSCTALNNNYLPPPWAFEQFGQAIRVLHINNSFPCSYYTADELHHLFTMCPNIVILCLDLVDITRDLDSSGMPQDVDVATHGASADMPLPGVLKHSLQVLASLPDLRTLRITNSPMKTTNNGTHTRSHEHWSFANAIFQFLAENGSRIKRLVFNPGHRYYDRSVGIQEDSWGHTWPIYAYEKGECEARYLETYIYTSMCREDDIAALAFLQPLRKLKTIVLSLEADNDEDMPVPGTFLQQGDELQFLHIGSGLLSRVHYKANSLEALGRICPEVQVLCIELADIEGDMNDLEKTKDFVLPPRNEATDSLNMLKDILVYSQLS